VRMRKIEADVSNINASTTQQLDVLQSKLLDLETRIINLNVRKLALRFTAAGDRTDYRKFEPGKLPHRTLAYIT
jgi:hypothetical protein